jgi:hypothetical protein
MMHEKFIIINQERRSLIEQFKRKPTHCTEFFYLRRGYRLHCDMLMLPSYMNSVVKPVPGL